MGSWELGRRDRGTLSGPKEGGIWMGTERWGWRQARPRGQQSCFVGDSIKTLVGEVGLESSVLTGT